VESQLFQDVLYKNLYDTETEARAAQAQQQSQQEQNAAMITLMQRLSAQLDVNPAPDPAPRTTHAPGTSTAPGTRTGIAPGIRTGTAPSTRTGTAPSTRTGTAPSTRTGSSNRSSTQNPVSTSSWQETQMQLQSMLHGSQTSLQHSQTALQQSQMQQHQSQLQIQDLLAQVQQLTLQPRPHAPQPQQQAQHTHQPHVPPQEPEPLAHQQHPTQHETQQPHDTPQPPPLEQQPNPAQPTQHQFTLHELLGMWGDNVSAQGLTFTHEQLLRVRATLTSIEHPSFTLPRNLRHVAHAGTAAHATFATPSSASAAVAAASTSAAPIVVAPRGFPIHTLATAGSSFRRLFDYYTEVLVEKDNMNAAQLRLLSGFKTFHEMVERDSDATNMCTHAFLTKLDEKREQRIALKKPNAAAHTVSNVFVKAKTTRVDGWDF
jgi:hypothetical protein